MDDLEDRLRRLKMRPPGEGLDRRVVSQRPRAAADPHPRGWWRGSIAVPWPAAAALVLLLVLALTRMPSSPRTGWRSGGSAGRTDLAPSRGETDRSETCLYVPGKGMIFHRVDIR